MNRDDDFIEIPDRTGSSNIGRPSAGALDRIGSKKIVGGNLTVGAQHKGLRIAHRNLARRTALKIAKYLKVYAETGRKYLALRASGLSSGTTYQHRKYNINGFRDREREAGEQSAQILLDEAYDRAMAGSDFMLAFCLNGLMPGTFKGGGGGRGASDAGGTADPRAVAMEMRRVFEDMADYCPPVPDDPVERAIDVTPTK